MVPILNIFRFLGAAWSRGISWVACRFSQCWFRLWLGAEQATSHNLNQCWPRSLTQICGTRGRWFQCHHQGCLNNAIFSNLRWCMLSASHVSSRIVADISQHPFSFLSNCPFNACGKTSSENILSLSSAFSTKLLLFRFVFLIFSATLIIFTYFLLVGLLLQHVALF